MKRSFLLLVGIIFSFSISAQKPELMIPTGHSQNVFSVDVSFDGKYLVTGSSTVKLFETASGKEIKTFAGNTDHVHRVKFSPDGKYIASSSDDQTLKIWETVTGKLVKNDKLFYKSVSFDFSADSKTYLNWENYQGIEMGEIKAIKYTQIPTNDEMARDLVVSPDGKTFAYSDNKGIKIVSIEKKKVIDKLNKHDSIVTVLTYSPNGKYLASGGKDFYIGLWNTQNGKMLYELRGDYKNVLALAFSPDNKYLASGSYNKIVNIWDVASGRELISKRIEPGFAISSLKFSPDGRFLYLSGGDITVKQYDLVTGKETGVFKPHADCIPSMLLTPDNKNLICGSWDKTIKIFDLTGQKGLSCLIGQDEMIQSIDISKDGNSLVVAGFGSTFKLWDLNSNKIIREYKNTEDYGIDPVSFTADNKSFVSSTGYRIVFWDVFNTNITAVHKTDLMNKIFKKVVLSPNGELLAGPLSYGGYWVWNMNKSISSAGTGGKGKINDVGYSPDGKFFATAGEDGLELFLNNNRETVNKSCNTTVVFNHKSDILASAKNDGEINLWNAYYTKEFKSLLGHTSEVKTMCFSKDDKYLFSAGMDSKVNVWDVATGNLLASIFFIDQTDWAVVTPSGHFDGTSNAMKLMYYVQNFDVLPLESFYEKFYTPNLYARLMGGEKFESKDIDFSKPWSPPPSVTIINPKKNDLFDTPETKVTIEATDMGGGIDEIRLFLNGKVVSEDERGFKKVEKSEKTVTKEYSVLLIAGTNELKAVAFNHDRTESLPYTITVDSKTGEANSDLYIIAVGIDEYKNPQYKLNFGKADAQAFATTLEQNGSTIFKSIKKVEILDTKASKIEIVNAFNNVIANAKPQDVFIFFYAGHGVMSEPTVEAQADFYLAPFDVTQLYGRNDMLTEKAISAKELKGLCTKIKAQKQVILLDACQSGGAVETFAMRGAAEEKAVLQLGRSTGVVVFASTGTDQFASEFKDLNHGVFTYALIKGLNGAADGGTKDAKITIKEIDAYLNDAVPELTQKYRGTAQYPKVWSSGMDFPIGVVK